MQGYYKNGQQLLEKALELTRETGDEETEGVVLIGIGEQQNQMGECSEALKTFEQLSALAERRNDHLFRLTAYDGIGSAYGGLGEHKKAIGYLEEFDTC